MVVVGGVEKRGVTGLVAVPSLWRPDLAVPSCRHLLRRLPPPALFLRCVGRGGARGALAGRRSRGW